MVLSGAVYPDLAEIIEEKRPLEVAGRGKPFIAGARFEPATFGVRDAAIWVSRG
jgi:hypothetical protein